MYQPELLPNFFSVSAYISVLNFFARETRCVKLVAKHLLCMACTLTQILSAFIFGRACMPAQISVSVLCVKLGAHIYCSEKLLRKTTRVKSCCVKRVPYCNFALPAVSLGMPCLPTTSDYLYGHMFLSADPCVCIFMHLHVRSEPCRRYRGGYCELWCVRACRRSTPRPSCGLWIVGKGEEKGRETWRPRR